MIMDLLLLAGVGLIIYGLWLIYPPVALIIAGILVCLGIAAKEKAG